MGRKATESFHEFKSRMIDPISETFCAAKWYNATIWLGHGQTTSCHHPPAHRIDVNEIAKNPSAIHNTEHKKLMRKYMQEGVRPAECEYCWKVEDIGKNNVSDRVYKTEIFKDEDIVAAGKMPWDSDVMLRTLEISFERTCNFACSYCNPAFSTTWVKDIKKFGPYRNIESDGRGHFVDTAPWAANAGDDDESNPYIRAFWQWWNSGLADNLEEIRITGGEPLMAPSVWKLFDWYKNNPERGAKMRFAMNSNLVPKKQQTLDKLIENSKYVPHFEVYTSNESVGAHSDYIRDGMKYDEWKANMHRLCKEANLHSLHVMMTINSLCLSSITEFMDEMLEYKREYGHRFPTMTLNILRFPSFQSAAILPKELKLQYRDKLKTWLDTVVAKDEKDREGFRMVTDMERAHVQRLIDYLESVETPHKNTSEKDKLYNDFKNFFLQYDVRRGKSFRATFPKEFVDFIDSIDVSVPTAEQILHNEYDEDDTVGTRQGDPATTEAGYVSDEVAAHGWDTKKDQLGTND